MTDFLRSIAPFVYGLIPLVVVLFVVYRVLLKQFPDEKATVKRIYRLVMLTVVVVFAIILARFAFINEVPQSDVDHSIKKERSNYSLEQAKKDTVTVK